MIFVKLNVSLRKVQDKFSAAGRGSWPIGRAADGMIRPELGRVQRSGPPAGGELMKLKDKRL
jgi:hypothetical protein